MKLVVSELSKTYERFNKGNPFFIVNNLSFTINEREIYALVGQNGAGKTTTIKCKFHN